MDGIHCVAFLGAHKGQRLRAVVGELLFYYKGGRNIIALIHVAVGDEAVHLGPQGQRFYQRGHNYMKHGVGQIGLAFVLLGDIGIDGRKVDALGDVGFVIAAIGINQGRDIVHGIQLAHEPPVLAISKPPFVLLGQCHFLLGERADIENAAPYAAQDSILSLIVNNFNTIAVDLQLRIEMIAAKIQCVRAFLRICQNRGGQGIKMKRV